MRLVTAVVAAMLVIGLAATVAQSSNGDTAVLGQKNSSNRMTLFEGTKLPVQAEADHYGEPTVGIRAASPDRSGLGVQGGLVTDGLTVNLGASFEFVRVVDVAPGDRSVVWQDGQPNGIPNTPFVLTDLQSVAKDLWITSATADPDTNTATVYLNRVVHRQTPVAIAVFGRN